MSGEGIREKVWREACSVLDISPTILNLMVFPDGALTPWFRKQHPLQVGSTHENLRCKALVESEITQLDRDLAAESIERLRSFGYIE